MSSAKKITLKSSDGEAFEVDEAVALQSQAIKYMIENNCADSDIPLPNVTSKILAKVIEYCEKHVEATNPKDIALMAWDAAFIQVDLATLMDVVLAAKYLEIESLRYLACKTLAQAMKWVTPDDLLDIAQGEDSR